ncbi:MAG TPA: N,N-dimethylformamidase beta subunit family domain-containing protein [Candidatus Dormibacteraeota bacterium]|nr:N,N-dimethylformamidase beta subunit family domain-containing protein [Candidatus Dormibacteraeota bacterium]
MGIRSAPSVSQRLVSALFALGLLAAARPLAPVPAHAATNPIVTENQQPGSAGWQLGSLVSDDVTGQIKGYGSATSVLQNQALSLYITVNPVQTYSIDFYRIGWYGGQGGRLRLHVGPLAGLQQQPCLADQITGMISCAWTSSYTLTIPADWTTGMYFAVLSNAAGYQNIVPFVVRDGRPAAILYQQSVNTDEGYNNYPDDKVTGKSLYDYNSYGANTSSGGPRAAKISFDRPWTGYGVGQFVNWEVDMVRWLERSGYDVTYSTDVDTHANGAELKNHKAFIVVGHDKYWTKEMRDAAEAARDAGVNLAFFGSDDASMQMRYEASASGVPNRVLVCYKDATKDPVQGGTTTVEFRTPQVNRPEQTLEGVQWTSQTPWGTTVDYVVNNSSNWVYAGTGLRDNDTVHGIVGYEMDKFFPEYPAPNATSRTILSNSPFTAWPANVPDHANSSIYQAPSGAWVFAAGTMSWAWGLDDYNHAPSHTDARIQQTTTNILNQFVSGTPPALTLSGITATTGSTSAVITWQTNNAANSRVDYGASSAYGSTASDPNSVTNHSVTLTSLTANTTYHYQVTSVDGFSQTASSVDASFTTSAPPALQVTGVQANPGTISAVINWQTNNAASSRVDYGATTAYGSTASDPNSVTSHSVTLTGLTPSTTYHYQVTSVDGFSQTASSADAGFTTSALPNLIQNPGYESGSANWSLDPGASIDTTPANAHSGSNSLTLTGLLAWQGSWQYVPVTAGQSYTFSGWERSTSTTGNSGYITLTAYDTNYVQIGSGTSLAFASTGAWSSKTGTYIPPAGAVRVSIRVQNDGPGSFWFDDLSLTQP